MVPTSVKDPTQSDGSCPGWGRYLQSELSLPALWKEVHSQGPALLFIFSTHEGKEVRRACEL